jgi:hypothetical protein
MGRSRTATQVVLAATAVATLVLSGCSSPSGATPAGHYPAPAESSSYVSLDDAIVEVRSGPHEVTLRELSGGETTEVGSLRFPERVLRASAVAAGHEVWVAVGLCAGEVTETEDDISCSEGKRVELHSADDPASLREVFDSKGDRSAAPGDVVLMSGPWAYDGGVLLDLLDVKAGAPDHVLVTEDGEVGPFGDGQRGTICGTGTELLRLQHQSDMEAFRDFDFRLQRWTGEWSEVPLPAEIGSAVLVQLNCAAQGAVLSPQYPPGTEGSSLFRFDGTSVEPVTADLPGPATLVTPEHSGAVVVTVVDVSTRGEAPLRLYLLVDGRLRELEDVGPLGNQRVEFVLPHEGDLYLGVSDGSDLEVRKTAFA